MHTNKKPEIETKNPEDIDDINKELPDTIPEQITPTRKRTLTWAQFKTRQ